MPQQTELREFHHLTVTPKVRLRDELDPTRHKKDISDGRSRASRVQREDEAVQHQGRRLVWSLCHSALLLNARVKRVMYCKRYLPCNVRGGSEMPSLVETLPVRSYTRNQDRFPSHIQPDVVCLLLTCCHSRQLTAKHESAVRQDDAATNTSVSRH